MPAWLRLGTFYLAMNLVLGVSSPFAGLWFKARGLDGAQIGLILAAPMLGRIVTGPMISVAAEGFRSERTGMAWVSVGAAAAFAAMPMLHGALAWGAAWFCAGSLIGALAPLADALALRAGRLEHFDYGRPRSMGSGAFVAGVVGGGVLIQQAGAGVVMPALAMFAAMSAVFARFLPRRGHAAMAEAVQATRERWARVGRLVRDPTFMLAIGSAGLINAAHGFYYGFSTLVWRRQGIGAGMSGALWGVGVTAEVAFLWFGASLRRRIGSERLLILGGCGAVLRWSALALSPPLWTLFPLQLLHVLTFACPFLASLQLAERLSPPGAQVSAQTLNNALSAGLLLGGATLASGPCFDAFGAGGYWLMALTAALGLAGALALVVRLRRQA